MTEENDISGYKVKTVSFEGPLELLLSLIEQRKLFVNEISLADVTSDYISYVKSFSNDDQNKRVADISYFVLIAATLILIKSKSLLPNLSLTEDEEEKIVDLEHRLRLYQIIKNANIDVKNSFGAKVIFTSVERVWSEPLFSPDPQISVASMTESIQSVFSQVPKKAEKLPEIEVRKVISIDEMIQGLTDRIQTAMNLSFRDFVGSQSGETKADVKVNVIVSFLAMLELVREGIIDVIQNASFEDISISKQEITENM